MKFLKKLFNVALVACFALMFAVAWFNNIDTCQYEDGSSDNMIPNTYCVWRGDRDGNTMGKTIIYKDGKPVLSWNN